MSNDVTTDRFKDGYASAEAHWKGPLAHRPTDTTKENR